MQKIGTNGDGKSAVVIPDGRSRKNKKKLSEYMCKETVHWQTIRCIGWIVNVTG